MGQSVAGKQDQQKKPATNRVFHHGSD